MLVVLTGFAVVALPIVAGYFFDRWAKPEATSSAFLHKITYWVFNPALVFVVLAVSTLDELFSPFLLAFTLTTAASGLLFVIYGVLARRPKADVVVGASAAIYTNSTIIGIPIATYVLGTTAHVAPVMLLSMLVIAPVTIVVMGIAGRAAQDGPHRLASAFASPVVVAAVLGTLVGVSPIDLPEWIIVPLDTVGRAAIPLVLVAFGMSLRHAVFLRPGIERRDTLVASAIKTVGMPVLALLIGLAAGLPGDLLYGLIVMSALPTAQNLLNYAVTFGSGEVVARDSMLLTTALSLGSTLLIAAFAAGGL